MHVALRIFCIIYSTPDPTNVWILQNLSRIRELNQSEIYQKGGGDLIENQI